MNGSRTVTTERLRVISRRSLCHSEGASSRKNVFPIGKRENRVPSTFSRSWTTKTGQFCSENRPFCSSSAGLADVRTPPSPSRRRTPARLIGRARRGIGVLGGKRESRSVREPSADAPSGHPHLVDAATPRSYDSAVCERVGRSIGVSPLHARALGFGRFGRSTAAAVCACWARLIRVWTVPSDAAMKHLRAAIRRDG